MYVYYFYLFTDLRICFSFIIYCFLFTFIYTHIRIQGDSEIDFLSQLMGQERRKRQDGERQRQERLAETTSIDQRRQIA